MSRDEVANDSLKLDYNDILIKPSVSSDIISRSEIEIYDDNIRLPLFTAPMDTVVDESNSDLFLNNAINVCLPRGEKAFADEFESYSLTKFEETFLTQEEALTLGVKRILIDTANGHIDKMVDITKRAKDKWGKDLDLMVGNVANAETYRRLSDAGADYIRVGIGNGGGCLTTQQTGVGYPMASLIRECYYASYSLDKPAKIVADGGMQTYSDIIKALALGADYVMVGSIFNKCLESCGSNYVWKKVPITLEGAKKAYGIGMNVYKKFRGMSTKEVQKKWGNDILKTSEGVVRFRKVEYTLDTWVENFESYLRSAMSYSNARNLKEFVDKVEIIKISNNAYKRFNK
jgi:IMP dehydrogenase/GMP reductase